MKTATRPARLSSARLKQLSEDCRSVSDDELTSLVLELQERRAVHPDQRVGRWMVPASLRHSRVGQKGLCLAISPKGTNGIQNPEGVITLLMESGVVVTDAVSNWTFAR